MFVMVFKYDVDRVHYFVSEQAAIDYANQLVENGCQDFFMIMPEEDYLAAF